MKQLFILILSVMLISCSSEPELIIEKFNDDGLKDLHTVNPNKYKIDRNIYLYMAYDRQSMLDETQVAPGCIFRIYNLKFPIIYSPDNMLNYLNEVDTPSQPYWIKSTLHKNWYYSYGNKHLGGDKLVRSIWSKQSDLPGDFFNPFHLNLADFYQDKDMIQSSAEVALNECLQFFYDGAINQAYTEKYHLNFLEKYRDDISESYLRDEFERTLKDKDTLVSFNSNCWSSEMMFLSSKTNLLITVGYGLRSQFPNLACK
ncbi:hypothetical protein [Neisseria shayeganii]|uniref:Lipoprotein n=1 Tax=Neisseria shayeganii TaxID=607712 RepID=A0A7D7S623_9NEIS|nr:hypothetical protein [Neisseria shayeganii]QMT41306.1 hypothetical protein H3L94_04580 [Neisseria shayeganii]